MRDSGFDLGGTFSLAHLVEKWGKDSTLRVVHSWQGYICTTLGRFAHLMCEAQRSHVA